MAQRSSKIQWRCTSAPTSQPVIIPAPSTCVCFEAMIVWCVWAVCGVCLLSVVWSLYPQVAPAIKEHDEMQPDGGLLSDMPETRWTSSNRYLSVTLACTMSTCTLPKALHFNWTGERTGKDPQQPSQPLVQVLLAQHLKSQSCYGGACGTQAKLDALQVYKRSRQQGESLRMNQSNESKQVPESDL